MREVPIDMGELAMAFSDGSTEVRWYLDLASGAVALVDEESQRVARELFAELGGDAEGAALDAALAEHGIPAWQGEVVRLALAAEADPSGARLLLVPRDDRRDAYDDMAAFVETVGDARLARRLADAIGGRGAFRRFKDALLDAPADRERWFAFVEARRTARLRAWLADVGVAPVDTSPPRPA